MEKILLGLLMAKLFSSLSLKNKGITPEHGQNGKKIFKSLEEKIQDINDDMKEEVVVRFKEQFTIEEVEEIIGPFELKYRYKYLPAFAGSLTKIQIKLLSKVSKIRDLQLDAKINIFNQSSTYWHGVDEVYRDFGYDGSGVNVAVIDTGIDTDHVDLDQGKVIYFKDWIDDREEPYDDNGHGTHVAGTIAGTGEGNQEYKGVAPGANLIGLKVLDNEGGGSLSDVDQAIEWCIENKEKYNIKVINLSLGASGSSDGTDSTSTLVNKAVTEGIVTVVAAGNEGPASYTIGSPGAAEQAITVGAMVDVGEGGYMLAQFSSRGPTADNRIKPDICAPGYNIMSVDNQTEDGYLELSGTSMATPYVAGSIALMLQAEADLTPTEIKEILINSAQDFGISGKDIDYGAGRISVYRAIKDVINSKREGPIQPEHRSWQDSLQGTKEYKEYPIEVNSLEYPIGLNLIILTWDEGFLSKRPDFDLYLYNPDGQIVASSEGTERQENISYSPEKIGEYIIRVYSYRGKGDYVLDASF